MFSAMMSSSLFHWYEILSVLRVYMYMGQDYQNDIMYVYIQCRVFLNSECTGMFSL